MTRHPFVWTDLSTYDIRVAKRFYGNCFGWKYRSLEKGYFYCTSGGVASASGLYSMPEKFQSMCMPSFWMSYLQVTNIQRTVALAESHGGKIEVRPESAPGGGLIALIRDPSGAGFTCYEGDQYTGLNEASKTERDANPMITGNAFWRELHVSNIEKVKSFYPEVFGWALRPTGRNDRYELFASADDPEPVAGIQQTDNQVKGDKEYWGVYFAVTNLSDTEALIESHGGSVCAEQSLGSRRARLVYDSQGAAFYIVGVDGV